jgi:translation initiation factor 6 (eIF-6)
MGYRAIKIDTLNLAKELENAGIPKPQAEAQLKTTIKVIDMVIEEKLATKHDLLLTQEKLSDTIKHVEEKLSARIDNVEAKLTELKHDLEKNVIAINNSIALSASNLKGEMKDQLNRLILIFGGMLAASVLLLAAIIKF